MYGFTDLAEVKDLGEASFHRDFQDKQFLGIGCGDASGRCEVDAEVVVLVVPVFGMDEAAGWLTVVAPVAA